MEAWLARGAHGGLTSRVRTQKPPRQHRGDNNHHADPAAPHVRQSETTAAQATVVSSQRGEL